jgi:hypothetical protein
METLFEIYKADQITRKESKEKEDKKEGGGGEKKP